MRSTFFGLEMAKRGLYAQQTGLYVAGNNISNVNTDGYSRQRVNFIQSTPWPSIGLNRPQVPGQLGTGVETGSIQRIRNEFIDLRYRNANTDLGYYSAKSDALSRMEDVLNEPTSEGLSAAMDNFWNSLQVLGASPSESGARESALAQANALADTFNYMSTSLQTIRSDLKLTVQNSVDTINSLVSQINSLNQKIAEVEPHGDLPNKLYDERDLLVDQLSSLVNIKIERVPSGGLASSAATGIYKIDIVDKSGNSIGTLVDDTTMNGDPNKLSYTLDSDGFVDSLKVEGSSSVNVENFATGSLKSTIEMYGYIDNSGNQAGAYHKMMDDLDKLAYALVKEFNSVHSKGLDSNGNPGGNLFNDLTDYKGAAKNMTVAITDISQIAATAPGNKQGNGDNAFDLADVMRKDFDKFDNATYIKDTLKLSGNVKSAYAGIIAALGVETKESNVLTNNTLNILDTIHGQRQSVSSVSLDDEMTDLIRFQHAYNASARCITMIDETLEKIINGMGVVGR